MLRSLSSIGFALLLAAARVDAAPAQPVVRFVVESRGDDAACLSESAVRAAVRIRLGRDPFRTDAADLLRVTVDHDAAHIERFTASGDARGERELELRADDCGELLETLSLSIAIAIDPFATTAVPVAEIQPVVAPSRIERKLASPLPTIDAWAAAGALGAVGAQPEPSAGITLQLGARRASLVIAIEGRSDHATTRTTDDGAIRVSSMSAIGLACVVVRGPRLCVLAGVDRLHGEGRGFTESRSAAVLAAVGGGRIAWPVPLGPLRIVPHVDVKVRAGRTAFEVDQMTIWEAPRVNAAVGAALEIEFF